MKGGKPSLSEKKAEKRAKNGRNPDGTFAIGNKGGGRPKKPAALKRHAQEAVEELYEIACDASNPVKVRADIWRWFAEFEYGKAVQQVIGDEAAPVVKIVMNPAAKEYGE